ncbi:MAG TPA: hypothetical protein VFK68_10210 [Propionibacteriaceae bacterium]|nr:hypothetical protein [Propionibacteriaceae bacterium]
MKGSHLAALVTGWLAVAMASAAIGSASVARVGLAAAEPRSQITVTRSAAPVRSFPAGGAAADFVDSNVASGRADGSTLSVPPYRTPSVRPTALPVLIVSTAPTAPVADQPIIVAPPSSGPGGGPTLGLLPSPTPTTSSTAPGKGPTKKPYPGKPSPSAPVPSVLLASPTSSGGVFGGV